MGSPATFPIWDAAGYGRPQFDVVNGMKSENGVSMVCLTRSLEGDSQPSLEVFSFDPVEWDVVGAANRALMSLAGRFAAISGSGMRDAVNDLTARAFAGGVPKRLAIGGVTVDARRFDVPGTDDWVIAAASADTTVAVAGTSNVNYPELTEADMALWAHAISRALSEG
jgi:hypothetical protein